MLVDQLRHERFRPEAVGLDVCTGSGVLAIAAAQLCCSRMVAVDISRRAVLAVRLNAALNRVDVRPVRGDLFAPVRQRRFDLIVSNPPYLPTPDGELPSQGPSRAWEGGIDGRAFLDRICSDAPAHLRPGGVVMLVHSSVCDGDATVSALSAGGLDAKVVFRHRGALGPLLKARQAWLERRGLLTPKGEEDMLVIRGQMPADLPPKQTATGRRVRHAAAR